MGNWGEITLLMGELFHPIYIYNDWLFTSPFWGPSTYRLDHLFGATPKSRIKRVLQKKKHLKMCVEGISGPNNQLAKKQLSDFGKWIVLSVRNPVGKQTIFRTGVLCVCQVFFSLQEGLQTTHLLQFNRGLPRKLRPRSQRWLRGQDEIPLRGDVVRGDGCRGVVKLESWWFPLGDKGNL